MEDSKLFNTLISSGIFILTTVYLSFVLRKRKIAKQNAFLPEGVFAINPSPNKNSEFVYPHEHERKMTDRLHLNANVEDENIERTKVIVRVPATSANLGPGFDAIGMALDMWSEFTIERSDKFEIICEGEGSHDIPLDESNLVVFGLKAAFKRAGKEVPTLKYHLINRIPYARGLGSSSAAIVGGLVAGLVLAGHQVHAWGSEELLNMAAEIEGIF